MHDEQKIRRQAASWYLRVREGKLSEAENREWLAWQQESKDHKLAYRRIELTWHDLDLAKDMAIPSEARSFRQRLHESLGAGQEPLKWAAAMAGFLFFCIAGYLLLHSNFEQPMLEGIESSVVQTATAENKVINLPDGSTVTVGAKSIVSFNYTSEARRLTLFNGEALFTVLHDAERPFIVDIGGGQVRAIGTRFNIHRHNSGLWVSVVEGMVEVSKNQVYSTIDTLNDTPHSQQGSGRRKIVTAYQQVHIDNEGVIGEVKEVDIERVISWKENILSFEDSYLQEVVADINRYSDKELIIMDINQRNLRVTGTFFVGQLDNWLTAMETAYGLKIEPLPDEKIVIH